MKSQALKNGSKNLVRLALFLAVGLQVFMTPAEAWIKMSTGRGYAQETMNPAYKMVDLLPDGFQPQVTGIDSLSDGTMVISTRQDDDNQTLPPSSGKVYLVKGQHASSKSEVTYRVIAEGLFEAMGVAVVNDTIYTLTVQELVQLADVNKDGIYEHRKVVCQGWPFGWDGFEWAFGLVYKDGSFYGNLASASSPESQSQSPERGSVIKMQTNNTFEILNTGIRRSNGIGLGPNNDIFVTDNQGEYVPTNRLIHVQRDNWYGYQNGPNYNPKKWPLGKTAIWMEWWAVSRSPSQPSLLIQGPYAGQMITGDCTDPQIRRLFLEKVGNDYQGAVFHWATMNKSPANRFLMSKSGDIVVGGLGSFTQGHSDWNWGGGVLHGLQVLRPTGVIPFDILAVRAVQGGFDLEFTKPVGSAAEQPSNYEIKTWGYIRERKYDSRTQNERQIYPSEIRISTDRRRVFIALTDLTPENVVYFRLGDAFKSQTNESPWITEAWYTMNTLGTAQPFSPVSLNQSKGVSPGHLDKHQSVRFNSATRVLEWSPVNGGTNLIIRTLNGELVHSSRLTSNQISVHLPQGRFPAGIYSVSITSKEIQTNLKLAVY